MLHLPLTDSEVTVIQRCICHSERRIDSARNWQRLHYVAATECGVSLEMTEVPEKED